MVVRGGGAGAGIMRARIVGEKGSEVGYQIARNETKTNCTSSQTSGRRIKLLVSGSVPFTTVRYSIGRTQKRKCSDVNSSGVSA